MEDVLTRQKLVVREIFYKFFNHNQHPIAEKHFNSNFTCRFNQYQLSGYLALVVLVNRFRALFPDTHIEVDSIFSEGDLVCARWKMVLNANGKKNTFTTTGITIFRFRSGKIVQVEQQWNVAALSTAYSHIH